MIILSKEQILKIHASLINATGKSVGICMEGEVTASVLSDEEDIIMMVRVAVHLV